MDAFSTVARLHDGYLIEELAAVVQEVSQQVKVTGRAGKITLTINIAKAEHQELGIAYKSAISRTLPSMATRGAVLFVDDDGELHERDPRQPSLPFRRVDTPPIEYRAPESPDVELRGAQ